MNLLKRLNEAFRKDPLFYLLAGLAVIFFIIKLVHITYQSLWMDEGFYVLAAQKILKHGYPLYPSGHVLFKSIFYSYFLAGFSLVLGQNVFIYRLLSLLLHVLTPMITYKLGRKYLGGKVMFCAGLLLFLSAWETEYARTALYYSLLQLLFTISLLLFMRRRIFSEKSHFTTPWIATSLTHQLGMGLLFTFPAYMIVSPRQFFRRRNLLSLLFWVPFFLFIMFQEVLLWDVGQVYANQDVGGLSSLLGYFFKSFKPVYWKLLSRSHSLAFVFFLFASLVFCLWLVVKKWRLRKPQNSFEKSLLFLVLCFTLIMFGLGFMRTHPMPRYIFPFHFLFIIIVTAFITFILQILGRLIPKRFSTVLPAVALFIGYILLQPVSLTRMNNIIHRDYTDPVATDIIYTSGRPFPVDHQTPGEYVRHHRAPGDVVIAIHMIFQYLYAGGVDYWLFSGGPGTWDAWEQVDGRWQDVYLGIPWIPSLTALKHTIDSELAQKKRVWIITSNSESKKSHISAQIQQFLADNSNRIRWISRDGIGKVFLFSDTETPSVPHRYPAEWGIYHSRNLEQRNDTSVVRISRETEYSTALIFNGPGRMKTRIHFACESPRSLIEVVIWRDGAMESKRLFLQTRTSHLLYLTLKQKGRYAVKLRVVKGPEVFLKHLEW